MFRKIIFWTHLVSGLISGVVIAIMSITGIAIAFEEEMLSWIDREQMAVEVPEGAMRMRIADLRERILFEYPDFKSDYVLIPKSPKVAYSFHEGRTGLIYANPYTGELKKTRAKGAHDIIHELEQWHRFLGFRGDAWTTGRLITGISNLAFLLLCLTGLYLWIPRSMKWRLFKKALFFNKKGRGKVRDFNWHHVFGIWNLPVLAILAATAVVISFEWAHKIPFLLAGEEAPEVRDFRMMAVPTATVPEPEDPSIVLSSEELISSIQEAYTDWVQVGLTFPEESDYSERLGPANLDLIRDDYMPNRAWAPVQVDPYTGEILQIVTFADRSPGLRGRIWIRFLHTGGGFGIWGKAIATIATIGSLFLVYTGFALSYRRFFKVKRARI